MEKAGISTGKFIAGIVIAILVSSALSVGITSQLIIGQQGPQGEKGETGAIGERGPAGPPGATGATGQTGTAGTAGSTGATGSIGATGAQGPPGPQGLLSPDYDSGWVDITDMSVGYASRIQSMQLTHNLGSTNVIVDVTGLVTTADAPHQVYLGLSGYISGFETTYGSGTASSGIQTADGGYAILSRDFDGNIFLIKTNSVGALLWNKTYGTTGPQGGSIIQTSDRGYAIAGQNGDGNIFLIRTDEAGRVQWSKTYAGGVGYSLAITNGGGYAIAGYSQSINDNILLINTDSAGIMQWSKTYAGIGNARGYSIVNTNDGFAIAGETWQGSYGLTSDVYLVKTNQAGVMLWSKTYGGTGNDVGYSLVQSDDGGYAIAGTTDGVGQDVYLVKTDQAGIIQWTKTYGSTGDDVGKSIINTSEGGYAIAGYTHSWQGSGNEDVYLVKTDANGVRQWWMTYGGIYSNEYGYSLVQTNDSGYAIAGYSNIGGVYLVKTPVENGLAWINSANSIVLYRGETDSFWNYVRVRIWKNT